VTIKGLQRGQLRVPRSIDENTRGTSATSENPSAAFAIGIRFLAHTEHHRKHDANQLFVAVSSSSPAPEWGVSVQIAHG
jgi:hypothetical protein